MAIRIRCVGCGCVLATKVPQTDTILTCPSCKGRYSIRGRGDKASIFNIERQPQPYKCKYCEQTYGTPQALRSHYFKTHRQLFDADPNEKTRLTNEVIKSHEENKRWQRQAP